MTIQHGTVVATYTQNGTFYCNVRVPRVAVTHNKCPVVHSGTGDLHAIKEGTRVLIAKTTDEVWVVVGTLDSENNAFPNSVQDNERVIYADADTEIRLSKSNGSYQLDISTGADLNINAAGDVNITAGGNVLIDGIDFDAHTHDYADTTISDTSDGTGTATDTTETTQPPNP